MKDLKSVSYTKSRNKFYNQDCIKGSRAFIADNSVDLIVTDPPYGIEGDQLHKHYNRDERFVVDGYVEVEKEQYPSFSARWIKEVERILRPGGSMYIVSGYTNLNDILNGLMMTSLREVNHIIWKYNFGVYTTRKYVSSHYHILFYEKPGGRRTFNAYVRYGQVEKDTAEGSLNYKDREDVWIINREYKPGEVKNKNELPTELLVKMIQYSSNEGDLVCDLFLGGFSTAKVAIGLKRYAVGFELNAKAFSYQKSQIEKIKPGHLFDTLRKPGGRVLENYGKPWTDAEMTECQERFTKIYQEIRNKRKAVETVAAQIGRGYFSVLNIVDDFNPKTENSVLSRQERLI